MKYFTGLCLIRCVMPSRSDEFNVQGEHQLKLWRVPVASLPPNSFIKFPLTDATVPVLYTFSVSDIRQSLRLEKPVSFVSAAAYFSVENSFRLWVDGAELIELAQK